MQVADLTVEEPKLLIKETVAETMRSLLSPADSIDPDFDKQLRPEIVAQLRDDLKQAQMGKRGESATVVAKRLGLDWNEL